MVLSMSVFGHYQHTLLSLFSTHDLVKLFLSLFYVLVMLQFMVNEAENRDNLRGCHARWQKSKLVQCSYHGQHCPLLFKMSVLSIGVFSHCNAAVLNCCV